MTLTIKLDRNWRSFQLANSAPPLSVTDSAIAPSARMSRTPRHTQQPHQHTPEQVLVAVHAHARPTPPLGGGEHRALHSRGAPHRIIEWRAAARCAWPDGSAECCVCVCVPGAPGGWRNPRPCRPRRLQLGRGPHKKCKNDLDDQT